MNMHFLFCTYFRKMGSCCKVLALVFSFDCSFGKETILLLIPLPEIAEHSRVLSPRGEQITTYNVSSWCCAGKMESKGPCVDSEFNLLKTTSPCPLLAPNKQNIFIDAWASLDPLFFLKSLKSLWCLLPGVFLLILITYTGKKQVSPPYQAALQLFADRCMAGTIPVLSRAQKVYLLFY